MRRGWPLALLLASLLGCPSQLPAQTRAAPLYSLPPDGTWVEYDWETTRPGAGGLGQAGTLRLSSVGSTKVQGIAHRWVEITKEIRNGKGGGVERRSRKLLVDEQALANGRPFSQALVSAYDLESDGRVTRISRERLRVFTGLGIQGPQEELREISTGEEVRTALGVFRTRHVTARGSTAGHSLEYHGWLSTDLPFGWARIEIREPADEGPPRLVFRASASRMGQSARNEVDESQSR
jgi:hypothetical protein